MTSTRSITTAALIATVAAASAGTVAITAVDASAKTPASGTFTVRAHHGSETSLDLGRPGFSAGDQDLSTGPLTRRGKHVGHLTNSCTTVRVGRTADQLCTFALQLGGSQIAASGAVRAGETGPGTFALPIVGGTGRYRDAHGQITITAGSGRSIPITVSLH